MYRVHLIFLHETYVRRWSQLKLIKLIVFVRDRSRQFRYLKKNDSQSFGMKLYLVRSKSLIKNLVTRTYIYIRIYDVDCRQATKLTIPIRRRSAIISRRTLMIAVGRAGVVAAAAAATSTYIR